MAEYFFDTSAISKHYHWEKGSEIVDTLLACPSSNHLISRLTIVELHSVFAKKIRTGHISVDDLNHLHLRIRSDIALRQLNVIRIASVHFKMAEKLISRIGITENLRTLDALQLAVVLSMKEQFESITFVCADIALTAIASSEGLTVINPEAP